MTHNHGSLSNLPRSTSIRLALSLSITIIFIIVEIVSGIYANSLVLLTDAVHNVTDALTLALSWWAVWITTKPAHAGKTYGYHRAGILVALVNSTTLVLIALGISYQAYQRLVMPSAVRSDTLIGVGAAAVIVNLVTALLIRRGSEHDINLKSAFLHLMGDVISTLGAVFAGIIIHFTGLNWIDPLVSILIGFLILWNAWGILRESVDILMEATPADIDMEVLQNDILSVEGVCDVHDLHVWSLTRNVRTLSAHLITEDVPVSLSSKIRMAINELLDHRYGISHATLQIECEGCLDKALYCDMTGNQIVH